MGVCSRISTIKENEHYKHNTKHKKGVMPVEAKEFLRQYQEEGL